MTTPPLRHQGESDRPPAAPKSSGVRVAVRDNGHGFDTSDATRRTPQQWGLATMRERAQQIGADFRCASGPGGTTVETAAPLPVVG